MTSTVETKLSVLMPAKNSAKNIRIAVLSCLLAMPRKSELLIFLDNCTDNTKEIVSKIKDKRIKIFESDVSIGHGLATNFLITAATGEFIARFDADDICLPGRFTIQLQWLKRSRADIVVAGAIKFRLQPFSMRLSYPLTLNSEQFNHSLVLMNSSFHSAMVVKRSALSESLLYERRNGAEDYMFLLKAALSDLKIYSIPLPMILYRLHPGQITAQMDYQQKINQDGYLFQLRNQLAHKLALNYRSDSSESDSLEHESFLKSPQFQNFVNRASFFSRIWFKSKLKSFGITANSAKFSQSHLAGALEMMIFRGLAAGITFALAYLFDPKVVGYYATPLLFLSLYQALIEGPVRTLAPRFSLEDESEAYVLRHSIRWRYISVLAMFFLTFATLFLSGSINATSVMIAVPLCMSPLIAGYSVLKQMSLQKSSKWKLLLKARIFSTLFAFLTLVSLLAATQRPELVGLFIPLVDLVLYLSLRQVKIKSNQIKGAGNPKGANSDLVRRLRDVVRLRMTSWLASQTDRLFIAILSGPVGLGNFAVSYAASRAIPDAIFLGGSYRLSAGLGEIDRTEKIKMELSHYVRKFLYVSLAFQIVLEILLLLTKQLISDDWRAAAVIVPVLVLSLIPQLVSSTMSVVVSHRGKVSKLTQLQFATILVSIAVAFVFQMDMIAGSLLLVGREIAVAVASMALAKEFVSRAFVRMFVSGAFCAVLISLAFRVLV